MAAKNGFVLDEWIFERQNFSFFHEQKVFDRHKPVILSTKNDFKPPKNEIQKPKHQARFFRMFKNCQQKPI